TGARVEFSADDGLTWTELWWANPLTRSYRWTVPNMTTGRARIRITENNTSSVSGTFSIMRTPANLRTGWITADSLQLVWDPVPSAVGYVIHMLGTANMDSIGFSHSANYIVRKNDPAIATFSGEQWFAVRAIGPDGARSRRCEAINVFINDVDLALTGPEAALHFKGEQLAVRLANAGLATLPEIDLLYTTDAGDTSRALFPGSLSPGEETVFAFPTPLPDSPYSSVKILAEVAGDLVSQNNALFVEVDDTLLTIEAEQPYLETFDGSTSLFLQERLQDDLDWERLPTRPQYWTGPAADHTTGSGLFFIVDFFSAEYEPKVGMLKTPSLDISVLTAPTVTFWYHMNDPDFQLNGSLKLEVLHSATWDSLWSASGEQGPEWRQVTLPLAQIDTDTVKLRFTSIGDNTAGIALDDFTLYDALPTTIHDGKTGLPERLVLHQNYPNPFNPETTLRYDLPEQSHVKIIIYNLKGQRVRTLSDEMQQPGFKRVKWDGTDDGGRAVAGGLYFYRIGVNKKAWTGRMLLVK
ncbi:T9SS type A sorting domain-containing protein, partial [bacterium]|nr:T9SS type A sorting domain-containing protein [bacterium]